MLTVFPAGCVLGSQVSGRWAAQQHTHRMRLEQYNYIGEASGLGLGERIFASAAKGGVDTVRDGAYREFAASGDAQALSCNHSLKASAADVDAIVQR